MLFDPQHHHRWLVRISPHAYTTPALMWLAFDGETYSDYQSCLEKAANGTGTSGCFGPSGTQILNGLGENWANTDVGRAIGILICMAVILRIFAWAAVARRVA